ncbi:MAG TPA: DUF3455 domain-containing protein [Candidatus Aquabacterium excrementipullorum]|nr:DUF3455 domain-containing protein [Candidatus Aquabacterium excrementipullorum]
MRPLALPLSALPVLFATACAMSPKVDNAALPEAVRVPAGHHQAWHTTTSGGEITYECRAKKDMPEQFEWAFVGPVATLNAGGKVVGKYYGGPTWEATDGSKVTGKQVAVSPAMPGAIPLQLVKANPAEGAGALVGVSYIQRLNTRGGVAPALPCGAAQKGQRQVVSYQADYVFYKPAM